VLAFLPRHVRRYVGSGADVANFDAKIARQRFALRREGVYSKRAARTALVIIVVKTGRAA
jgi:hypothetical protein